MSDFQTWAQSIDPKVWTKNDVHYSKLAWDEGRKELKERIDNLEAAVTKTDDDACQVLGKVLKYPWYKDDLEVFPNATEKMGVCVGDHVALSMAMEAAKRIDELEANNKRHKEIYQNQRKTIYDQVDRIEQFEAEIKEWESGARVPYE